MSAAAQNHLRQLVERYPYFHAARLLYLRQLFHGHDPSFGSELRKASLYVPSRQVLYQMIEGERLNPARKAGETNSRHKNSAGSDRTDSLIGQFLDTVSEPRPRRVQKVDATVDYIEYLRQSGGDSDVLRPAPVPVPADGGRRTSTQSVIDAFLDGDGKLEINKPEGADILRPETQENEGRGNDVLTEMMAKIYIKQEKYDKALEIIRRLYLKNPKKNRYFADQMRFLQKIIINNRNK